MELHRASFYVHELRPRLPAGVFQPAPGRLWWLPVHLASICVGVLAIGGGWVPWPVVPAISLGIGLSFGGLMFLGHETLHGGVVRGRWGWLKPIVGWICFAPFALSPRLWEVWHNQIHHAHANVVGKDPDMYPTLESYQRDKVSRFSIDHFALGGRRRRGGLSLLFGFVVQSKAMLLRARGELGMRPRQLVRVTIETLAAIALWVGLAIWLGALPFVFAFVIPHMIANVVVMGFILTNHGLSPAARIHDPLITTLSVTAPRWLEWLTLDFGYHVEHHVFPGVSSRHGRTIRAALVERWPDRYQSMGVFRALWRMHCTGRVYKDETTLVDPMTGGEWSALGSREPRLDAVPAQKPIQGMASGVLVHET